MGAMMGPIEAAAFTSVAEFLELAVSSGLVPGTRGWKTRQQALVRPTSAHEGGPGRSDAAS